MFEIDTELMNQINEAITFDADVDVTNISPFCILCSGGVANGCNHSCNNGCDGGCSATCSDDCQISCTDNCNAGCYGSN